MTHITSHCFARYLTFVPTNHFRGSHERSINAETLSRRCQTSVQLTLKLARLPVAAVIVVLLRHSRDIYFKSDLYTP